MEGLLTAARYTHILFGFIGLALFWLPVFVRKGGLWHRRVGRWFYWCANLVLGAAGVSLGTRFLGLALDGEGPRTHPEGFAFLLFLSYLAWVTWVGLRHGVLVLSLKEDREAYRTRLNLLLGYSAHAASVVLIAYALYYQPPNQIILFALSPIGFGTASGILAFHRIKDASPKAWFYEHMGSLLGTGIAFHTAFAVFGATRLFELGFHGWISVVPWVLPAAIGIPAIVIWTRYYRRRFGDLPSREVATA